MSDEYEVFESDVAIVGMAARLPGAQQVDELWDNLVAGREAIERYTEEELRASGERPDLLRRPNYVPAGAPMEGVPLFDGEFFGFSPKESTIMDPQHRHFLECAWEALEHAGHPPEAFDGPIGVFAGCGMGSYFYFNVCSNRGLVDDVGMFLLRHTGNDKDFLATRVSYLLDLQGPSVNVQTACSTSLVATHLAVQSLLARECDLALAGGVTIELPHRRGYLYEEGEVLSPTGHCHAFDHRAQGTVFGSGAGVVALRRLEDALDDGDVIHAVIRGSAINNDGATKVNYLAPSVTGQSKCMVEAYGIADVDPRTIEYIECHGTGTYLGDPIEVEALTQAFRTQTSDTGFCRLGSIKTNIGHLDTAAGVASLIKATLALRHATIPPTLNFEEPNPTIDFDASPFRVADELLEWPAPSGHPRRAAVNSLGVGGTNAHIVLQEPPGRPEPAEATREVQLITLSARTRRSLDAQSARLAAHLRAHATDLSLADVSYTLHHGRRAFGERRVLAVRSLEEAAALLEAKDVRRVATHTAATSPKHVLLLPGGGAQYPRMLADLYDAEPVVRDVFDRGLAWLKEHEDLDLRPFLFPETADEAAEEALALMVRQLPAIFLASVAMAKLLEQWGVEPVAYLGHSLGENTAAHLGGVMRFEDTLGLVTLRGRLLDRAEAGAMLMLTMSEAELRARLPEGLDLAVVNGPESCVVSGPPDAIAAFEAEFADIEEIETRRLAIPSAAHSRLLDPVLPDFRAYLESIPLSPPETPILCNTSGGWLSAEDATNPEYWVRHLRSTVRFAENVGALLDDGPHVMVEAGPGRTLSSLARQHRDFAKGGHAAFPSVRHSQEEVDDVTFFTSCLGRIWASGGTFDHDALWPNEERQRVVLPTYAWDHKSYFIEPAEPVAQAAEEELERLPDVGSWGFVPRWRPSAVDPREGPSETHLIFMDPSGVGRRLKERLEARGHDVVAVYEGDAFIKRGPHEYAISPERGREGYESLLTDLVAAGRTPRRITHLWLLDGEPEFRPGSDAFHHHLERGFYSLLFLAQVLADESAATPCHLTVVTHGALAVGEEGAPFPEKATVLGPAKVLSRELDGATVRVIDARLPERNRQLFGGSWRAALLDPVAGRRRVEAALDALAERLEDEVRAAAEDEIVALRDHRRATQVYEATALEEAEGLGALREGGTYLITGGLGGIGLTVAEHLAERCKARLVLLGRTPLPARDQWETWIAQHGEEDRISGKLRRLLAIEAAGGEVLVAAADVTNLEEMQDVAAEATRRFGRVEGIFHAAGVVDDDLIAMKSLDSVEEVFAPKIQGTRVLDEVFGEGLDLLVLFSSSSTATAPAGQVDYVAANAFLDAFAQGRRGGRTRVQSLHWGIWNEVGMAAESMAADELRIGAEVGEQPTHPFLDARVRDAARGSSLRGTLSPRTHWLLDGHRTKSGRALVPGTGYLEVLRAALRANGEAGPFEIEDLFFLRPFAVADDASRDLWVKLRPTQRGYAAEIRGGVEKDGRRGTVLCAQAHLALRPLPAPEAMDVAAVEARCTREVRGPDPAGMPTAQEAHLRFGPRWRTLRQAAFGHGEALGRLALPDAFRSEVEDFGLHPALLDIATGWAMELIEGYGAERLYVPVSYERVRVYDDLPANIVSWVSLARPAGADADAEFVFFDVTLADPEGRVLVEVDSLGLRRTAAGVAIGSGEVAASDVDWDPASGAAELSPAEERLARNLALGIRPEEGQEALARVLAGPDRPEVFVTSMDLHGLIAQAEAPARGPAESGLSLERPDLASEYVEPRDDIERTLVDFWKDLLGLEKVGVEDSFFDLGGHSLIAVRLFAQIKRAYSVDFAISALFEAPTIAACAALIRDAIGDRAEGEDATPAAARPRFTHLVAMHSGDGGPKTPFFLVAGMFGNVMNLRHLAHLVGTDRRFYGLQARGLFGDQEPHETFEEMAEAYIAELRTVQPHGPYFLGGFSGGGVTAYEMTRQLVEAGEEVALLVMLDTPVPMAPPSLSLRDRVLIQRQNIKEQGPGYLSKWARNRWAWEMGRLRRRFDDSPPEKAPEQFHDEAIEQAFRRALERYEIRPYAGTVHMFRPPLPVVHQLGDGRLLGPGRTLVLADNGWTPHVGELVVAEVPGDHDSMVLEPNVRVLARRIRERVEAAEAKLRSRTRAVREAAE
jgi:acyl transferase domain-containing protein/thioesterase domain-containing protein